MWAKGGCGSQARQATKGDEDARKGENTPTELRTATKGDEEGAMDV